MALLEPHPGGGEPIEMRRLVGLPAVGRDAFVAEVIGHDEDDVGLGSSERWRGGQGEEEHGGSNECKERFHDFAKDIVVFAADELVFAVSTR